MPKYVNCNFCDADDTTIIQKAEDPYRVVRCKNCGLVYVNPQPDKEFLESHYQESYYKEWIEKQMQRRISMWKKRLHQLKAYKKGASLLDVGCGIGTFLHLAKLDGFEIYGTEISEYASQYVKNELGIDIFKGNLEEAEFPSCYFDIITVWHTLEHLPNPMATLKEVNRVLKKDGLLVIAVPNLHNFITRILYLLAKCKKLMLFSNQAKEWHLYHFSAQTLSSMLKKTGFEIIKTDLDLAQIEFFKKIVDCLTIIIHFFTGKNFGEGIKIYAVKI